MKQRRLIALLVWAVIVGGSYLLLSKVIRWEFMARLVAVVEVVVPLALMGFALWHRSERFQMVTNYLALWALFTLNFVLTPWLGFKVLLGYAILGVIIWYTAYRLTAARKRLERVPVICAGLLVAGGLFLISKIYGYSIGAKDPFVLVYGPLWAVVGEYLIRLWALGSAVWLFAPRLRRLIFGVKP